jgi:ABC-type xylose transport system permease subunit
MSTQSIAPTPSLKRSRGVPVEMVVNNILLLALFVLVVYFTIRSGAFLTISNIKVLLTNYAAIGVVAATLALLVIAGHGDRHDVLEHVARRGRHSWHRLGRRHRTR